MHAFLLSLCCLLVTTGAASQARRYPVRPVPLPDADEVVLATSAAPAELSDSADVFTVNDGEVRKLRAGTSGAACMVARDLHEGSAYPICFNPEAARTTMHRELMEVRLRSIGVAEDSVARAVAAAYRTGVLVQPERFAVAYMMSPRQVLYSAQDSSGRRIGAWHPHIMIYTPTLTRRDLGFARAGPMAGVFQAPATQSPRGEFVVVVPRWADGTARSPGGVTPPGD